LEEFSGEIDEYWVGQETRNHETFYGISEENDLGWFFAQHLR
jgi:hypothetical protein